MIDTHSHLLPGLDDGCPSMESAVEMAEAAVSEGIEAVVCTPHIGTDGYPRMEEIRSVRSRLDRVLSQHGIELTLYVGGEVPFSFLVDAGADIAAEYAVEGTRALLVEMPSSGWPPYLEPTLHRLRLEGYLPVLAHPERNSRVQKDPGRLEELLRLGCVAQGTVSSIMGTFGRGPRACAFELLASGMLDVIATDAHYSRPESWAFAGAVREMEQRLPGLELDMLMRRNPGGLLDSGPLEEPGITEEASGWKRQLLDGVRGFLRY